MHVAADCTSPACCRQGGGDKSNCEKLLDQHPPTAFIIICCENLPAALFRTYQARKRGKIKHKENKAFFSHLQHVARLSPGNPKLGLRMHPISRQRREVTLFIPGFLCFAQYEARRSPCVVGKERLHREQRDETSGIIVVVMVLCISGPFRLNNLVG